MVLLLIMVVTPLLAMGRTPLKFRTASLLEIPPEKGRRGRRGNRGR